MKAVILAGGLATRLRPLTLERPKSLVPVLNRYFLEHIISSLKNNGIEEIVLATGHMASVLKESLRDGQQYGVRLLYAEEETPLGTAGAIKNCAAHLDSAFLVLNGDIFTDLDYAKLIRFHQEKNAMVTIVTTKVEDPSAFGLVDTDELGKVVGFLEKPEPGRATTDQINAGVYILNPEILDYIAIGECCSLEREIFPKIIRDRKTVYAYATDAYWIDIGTPQNYLRLNQDMLTGRCRTNLFKGHLPRKKGTIGAVLIGKGSVLRPAARVNGPTVIGHGCRVEDGAVIEASVLWDNVVVEKGVIVKNSIIASNCCLNEKSHISDSIIGPHVVISSDSILAPGSRIFP